jgi:hypothetical protein
MKAAQNNKIVKKFRRWKVIIAASLIVYVLVGWGRLLRAKDKREVFPAFHWFLFHSVPLHQTEYTIEVTSAGGRALDPPVNYQLWDGTVEPDSATLWRLIQIANTYRNQGKLDDANEIKSRYETQFFIGREFGYDLYKLSYNPLERWKTGEAEKAYILSTQSGVPFSGGQ